MSELELKIDRNKMPTDKLCFLSVLALEHLAQVTPCPNTRTFSGLFALHLCAKDWTFGDLMKCGCGNMLEMVYLAISYWVVDDRVVWEDACRAQDLLAAHKDVQDPLPRPVFLSNGGP